MYDTILGKVVWIKVFIYSKISPEFQPLVIIQCIYDNI